MWRVFLIHGMGRTPASMWVLDRRLRGAGYHPSLFGYFVTVTDLEEIEFLGRRFRVPVDTLQYIQTKYGKDWATPIKVWDWAVDPANAVETDIYLKRNKRKIVR